MTKNRGSEKTKFFVKKEEFWAKSGRTAENTAAKKCRISRKNVLSEQLFNFSLQDFPSPQHNDGGKKRSDFFKELSFFQKNLSRISRAKSPIFAKPSYRAGTHHFSKLSEYSEIFGQRFFLSEFSKLSNGVVKIFGNGRTRMDAEIFFSATDKLGWTQRFFSATDADDFLAIIK